MERKKRGAGPSQASWVRSLQAEQSKIAVGKVAETRASNVGLLVSLIGMTVMAGVPGYFVIQFIAAHRLRGRWRLASFAPLGLTVPATGYAIYALVTGCSLWPSVACVPVAFIYLLALYAVGSVIRLYPSAASSLQGRARPKGPDFATTGFRYPAPRQGAPATGTRTCTRTGRLLARQWQSP